MEEAKKVAMLNFTSKDFAVCALTLIVVGATVVPVLRAGEQPTQRVSRLQRLANSAMLYANDNDRVLPLGVVKNTLTDRWRVGSFAAIPAGWTTSANRHVNPRLSEEKSFAWNALIPYHNDPHILAEHHVAIHDLDQAPFQDRKPSLVNVNYNGLLHAYPVDAIAKPERLTFATQNYWENSLGFSIALPVLCCDYSGSPCRFNPTGYPQAGQTSCGTNAGSGDVWYFQVGGENFTVWVYRGRKMAFVSVDGSVELKVGEIPVWPQYRENVNEYPWSSIELVGRRASPYWMTNCVAPGKQKATMPFYAGFYRPDNEFTYSSLECDFGGG
ncbi:MAG: hypothetical protein KIT11_03445 [Fimbriimonadaceae bacterium]|nr:hypothetical protein [Fimbriimonadaceae bacterium]QYK57048.1 MAG: hypothetical protein KF733_06080 [Fimbriimonadaceae bacterium]